MGRPRKKIPQEKLDKMAELRKKGMSFIEIGKKVDETPQLVRLRLIEMGVHEVNPYGSYSKDGEYRRKNPLKYGDVEDLEPHKEEIIELYEEKAMEMRQIAREFNTSYRQVRDHLEKWDQEIYTRDNPRPRDE